MSSSFALALANWGPVILRSLPLIMKVGQDLYALYCTMRGTRQQNDAVLRAMKLLNRHQDDIDRLLQDPQQKRDLLEGLTVLMNRINEHSGHEGLGGACRGSNPYPAPPTAPHYHGDSGPSSFSKPSMKGCSWKTCDVCCCEYDSSSRRPTILICGHTFCHDCLREILHRGPLLCPTCRTRETRPLTSLPPNTGLIRVLEEDLKGDDSCCGNSSGGGGGGCDDGGDCNNIPLSFDQQIQYAIFLSQQQAEAHGTDCVASCWREVEETEDERLARALQDSEIYEASLLCARRNQAQGDCGALNPPDKEKMTACGGASASNTCEEEKAILSASEEEEAMSLQLAIDLQQQEMEMMQRLCGSSSSSSTDNGSGYMKDYHNFFGASLCGPVEEHQQNTSQSEENTENRREELQGQGEEDGATCCRNEEDEVGQDEADGEDACFNSRSKEDEGKKEKDGDECGKKCYEDDDCGKNSALMKSKEDLLIQMAIRLSLEQHEASATE